jgi:hypothetical protein
MDNLNLFATRLKKKDKYSPLKGVLRRLPGQSLDEEISKLKLLLFTFIIWALAYDILAIWNWWQWYKHFPPQPVVTGIIAVAVTIYAVVQWMIGAEYLKKLRLGRDGEREVGQALEELRQNGFAIFHDVIGSNFNVDHVIVSPHGIFAIETKTYSKSKNAKISYDGNSITVGRWKADDKPIKQAIAISDWLRDTLAESTGKTFIVNPVVVFPGWWIDTTGRNHRVSVLNPKQLPYWISQLPLTIPDTDVHLVAFHLSRLNAVHPSTIRSLN